jgi:hypothetical protein
MRMKRGDIVRIREGSSNTFYGWFKKISGLGIVVDIIDGYSSNNLYLVKVIIPDKGEKPFEFYKGDLKLCNINKLSEEELDIIMVDNL